LWQSIKTKIALDLVEFAPIGRAPTEAALAALPSLIVRSFHAVSPTFSKPQLAAIAGLEPWEDPWVQIKRDDQCVALHVNLRDRRAGFGVPAIVQLGELRV
jgi:hypothetical protein